jgi:hypothetical protein
MCSCGDYWGSESRLDRLDRCRRFLFGEGVLTVNENYRIATRLQRDRERKQGVAKVEAKSG